MNSNSIVMEYKKIAVDFVKWIMQVQDSNSWVEHSNGIWHIPMVGHMNTEALYDYYIEREGKQYDLENELSKN